MKKHPLFWLILAVLFFVFLHLIHAILLPFVLGIFTAYFLDPAADRLERAGLSRGASTLVITACFFLSLALLSVIIIPVVAGQFSGLIAALPGYITAFEQKYEPALSQWVGGLPAAPMDSIKSAVADFSGVVVKIAEEFIGNVFQSGVAVANILLLILITPVVAFYLLRDWDRLTARLDTYLPREHADTIREQLLIVDRTLAGWVRGQISVCLILATYYSLGLSLVGLKFGIVIGLATGLLVIFPYVGLMLGMSVGLAVAFFQFDSPGPILATLAVFLVGSITEGYIITPNLVGERVGLHPVWIIFGMLSGAALFGFVGILLAVPATAVIGVLIRFALERYLQSEYYQGSGA